MLRIALRSNAATRRHGPGRVWITTTAATLTPLCETPEQVDAAAEALMQEIMEWRQAAKKELLEMNTK